MMFNQTQCLFYQQGQVAVTLETCVPVVDMGDRVAWVVRDLACVML